MKKSENVSLVHKNGFFDLVSLRLRKNNDFIERNPFFALALKMANPLDELRDITLRDLIIKLDLSEDEFDDWLKVLLLFYTNAYFLRT